MTGWALPDWTGTERCNEAAEKLSTKYDLVVNIQGDEPLIDPAIIDGIVLALQVSYFLRNGPGASLVTFSVGNILHRVFYCHSVVSSSLE